MADLNKAQKIFMIIMYVLTGIATLLGCFSLYNLLAEEKPWTLGVVYASKLKTEEGQVPIVNVKVNGNENGNGLPVYDVQFNSYTDTEGNGIAGFGIQCIGDCFVANSSGLESNSLGKLFYEKYNKYKSLEKMDCKTIEKTKAFGDFYLYYTGDDGVTYHQLNYDKVDDYLLISINGDNYRLRLKEYEYLVEIDQFWDFLPWVETEYETKTSKFTWFEVFDYIITSAKTNSGKIEYEEFSLSLFDLSVYLDIQYMDNKGQYHNMPDTADNRTYLTIPVDYSLDGATEVRDSLFKQVAGSPTWNYFNNTDIKNYWNAYAKLTLKETHLKYVETSSGIIAMLDNEFADYLRTLTNAEIIFEIDLNNIDYNVSGFDFGNFDFKLNSINISTSKSQSVFKLFNTDKCSVIPTIVYGGV